MRFLYFFLILIFAFQLHAQQESQIKLQEYLPPSPTAQEFIKYGEYPVSLYTGIPNISIPLYEVRVNDIDLPISLSYHSSGIQVDQMATWVGLGWSLNSGGIISRIPKGKPDDDAGGFLSSDIPDIENLPTESEDPDFWKQAATGYYDTESDIYQYNFGGYSGKFFFDRNKEIQLIDKAPLKIVYTRGSKTFSITTEKGIKYEFLEIEKTHTASNGASKDYISSWHLTNIISKDQVTKVEFSYYEGGDTSSTNQHTYMEYVGGETGYNQHDYLFNILTIFNGIKQIKEIIYPNGKITFNRVGDRTDGPAFRLDELVVYKKDAVNYKRLKGFKFITDYFYSSISESGLSSTSPLRYRLRLDELREYGENATATPKTYLFEYNGQSLPARESKSKDFWGYYNGKRNSTLVPKLEVPYNDVYVGGANRTSDETYMKAGVLNKITYPTGGYTEFSHEPHEYITQEDEIIKSGTSTILAGGVNQIPSYEVTFTPASTVDAVLRATATNVTNGSFPRVTLTDPDGDYIVDYSHTPYEYGSTEDYDPLVNRTFHVQLSKDVTYTLRVTASGYSTYNEGAHAGYAFMSAYVTYSEETGNVIDVTKKAGGLRIKEIKSFNSDNTYAFGKQYDYVESHLITDEFFVKQNYVDERVYKWESTSTSSTYMRRAFYGGAVQQLSLNSGSPVVYSKVKEFSIDEQGGRKDMTEYLFTIEHESWNTGGFDNWRAFVMYKDHWKGGKDLGKTSYRSNTDGSFTEVYREEKDYLTVTNNPSYMSYKIVFAHIHLGTGDGAPPSNLIDQSSYILVQYPVSQGVILLGKKDNTTNSEEGEVTTSTQYAYNNPGHLQVTQSKTVSSDGKETITNISYPDDVTSLNALGYNSLSTSEFEAIDQLKKIKKDGTEGLHRIAEPIQEVTTVKNSAGTVLSKSVRRTNYRDWSNNIVMPEYIQSSKSGEPLENRIIYDDYDNKGNPLQLSRENGSPTSYIWGHNQQYPVAKIVNATRSQIEALPGFGNDFYASGNLTSSQESTLRTHSTMSDAMVTTYTYDPLTGVTSITDPMGNITYFEYDDFNRLEVIKDRESKLIEEYKYHYKN